MKDDDLIILDGCTFFYSSATGDLETGNSQGLFYMDVRHLSRWLLRVDGEELEPLSSRGGRLLLGPRRRNARRGRLGWPTARRPP